MSGSEAGGGRRPGVRAVVAPWALAVALSACGGPQLDPARRALGEPLAPGDEGRVLERRPVVIGPAVRGVVLPYSIDRVFSTFGDCRDGGRRQHSGLDLGGVGPNAGLGTPVRSMVRARITFLGDPTEDPRQFGEPDVGPGEVERGGRMLPRSLEIPGYGRVWFFSRDYGSWRTGTVVVTEGIGPPLDGHVIRYIHLGAIHPELRVGDVVEAGQEVGLLGGTAVLEDSPHLHLDITDPDGERVDAAPFLGMAPDPERCRSAR